MSKPEVRRRDFGHMGFEVLVRARGSRFHTDAHCPKLLRSQWDSPHQIVTLGEAVGSNYAPCSCALGDLHPKKQSPPEVERWTPRPTRSTTASPPDAAVNREFIGREVRIRTGGTRFHVNPSCPRLLRAPSDFRHEIVVFDEARAGRYAPCPCSVGDTTAEPTPLTVEAKRRGLSAEARAGYAATNRHYLGAEVHVRVHGAHYHADASCSRLIRSDWGEQYSTKALDDELAATYAPCPCSQRMANQTDTRVESAPAIELAGRKPLDAASLALHVETDRSLLGAEVQIRSLGSRYHADPSCPRLVRSQWEDSYSAVTLDDLVTASYAPCSCADRKESGRLDQVARPPSPRVALRTPLDDSESALHAETNRYLLGAEVRIRSRGSRYHTDPSCPRLLRPQWGESHTTVTLDDAIILTYAPCQCTRRKADGLESETVLPKLHEVREPLEESLLAFYADLNRKVLGKEVQIRSGGSRYHANPECRRMLRTQWDDPFRATLLTQSITATYAPCTCVLQNSWQTSGEIVSRSAPTGRARKRLSRLLDGLYLATSLEALGNGVLVRDQGSRYHVDAECPRLLRTQWGDRHRVVVLDDEITSIYTPCTCSLNAVAVEDRVETLVN